MAPTPPHFPPKPQPDDEPQQEAGLKGALAAATARNDAWAKTQVPKPSVQPKPAPGPNKQDAPPPQITAKDVIAQHKSSTTNLRMTRLTALSRRNPDVKWLLEQKSVESKPFKTVA